MIGRGSPLYNQVLPRLRPFQREAVEFAVSGKAHNRQFNAEASSESEAATSRQQSHRDGSDFTEPSLLGKGRILLADEMGLGKSLSSLAIMAYYEDEWPLLIICPASLRYTWPAEIEKFFPSISPQSVYIAAGFQDVGFTKQKDVKIVIITYSLIQNRSAVAHTLAEQHRFRCIIVDESHNLKQRDSQRTKLLLPILLKADRLLLLSGTPALARPCELWTQLTCLAPKVFGTWTAFANRYCNPHRRNIGGRYVMDYTGSSNERELHTKLKNVMVRRLKMNVLDELPPKQRSIVPVPISSDQKAACAHAMVDLKETRESVAMLFGREAQQADFEAKSKLMTAYQASGIGKAKSVAEYLLDWLSGSANQKILVFAHHKAVLDTIDQALMEKHPNSHIRIDGSVPTVLRAQLVKKFQTCERVRVGLLSMTAAGVGLTLTAASTVLFAELHWTPGVLAQCEDRAHRIGQTGTSVQILYAVCKDDKYSVDMTVWRMLGRKIGAVDAVVDGKEDVPYLQNAKEESEFVCARSGQEELTSFFADSASEEKTRRNRVPVKGSIENFFKRKASVNAGTSQPTVAEEGIRELVARPTPSVRTTPPSRSMTLTSKNANADRHAASHVSSDARRLKRRRTAQSESDESDRDELFCMPALSSVIARENRCHSTKGTSKIDRDDSTTRCLKRNHEESLKWTCLICTLENTKKVNKTNVYTCDACGEYFSQSQEESSFDETSFSDEATDVASLAKKGGSEDFGCQINAQVQWSCATCTLDNCHPRNKSGVYTCEACGAVHNTSISPRTPKTTRGLEPLAPKVSQTPSKERPKNQLTTSTEVIILDVKGMETSANNTRAKSRPSEIIEIDLTDEEGDGAFDKRHDCADERVAPPKVSTATLPASFSVSKNSGRISVHLGSRRESSGVNFDLDDVVTADTADRLLDARTDRRSVSLIKPAAIHFNPAGVNKVLRSVLDSCPFGGQMRNDDLADLESRLKAFVSAYARLREVEKKAVKDAGQPIEPSELAQHVASLLVATATGSDRYTGGAKERARERMNNGVETEGDAAVLDGKGCAWCGTSLHQSGILAGSTYCTQECAEEGRLRRGGINASVRLRSAVFALEGGRCTICGMDCHSLYQQVVALDPPQRLNKLLSANWRLPKSAKSLETLLQNPREGDFWQVDHILAVSEGGGGCGLENLRTLCVPCHNAETEKLRARLRLAGPYQPHEAKKKQPSLNDFFGGTSDKSRST